MPRFAILCHDWPTPHWDLLLEDGESLRAWRLHAEPHPGSAGRAEPNADHRKLYLDYEGTVAGHRGTVTRWAAGEYAALGADSFELRTPAWHGIFTLRDGRFRHSPMPPGGA